jgi:hypothetical protein
VEPSADAFAPGDHLTRALDLDKAAAGWKPTVDNYLGRVPKARIREAVREASIPDHAHANFQTLLRAGEERNLALMEFADALTGETRYVICAVGRDGANYVLTPFGHLSDGNPYDAYLPPSETLQPPLPA